MVHSFTKMVQSCAVWRYFVKIYMTFSTHAIVSQLLLKRSSEWGTWIIRVAGSVHKDALIVVHILLLLLIHPTQNKKHSIASPDLIVNFRFTSNAFHFSTGIINNRFLTCIDEWNKRTNIHLKREFHSFFNKIYVTSMSLQSNKTAISQCVAGEMNI